VLIGLIIYRLVAPAPKKEPELIWQREVKTDYSDEIREIFERRAEQEPTVEPLLDASPENAEKEPEPAPRPEPRWPRPEPRWPTPRPVDPRAYVRRPPPEPEKPRVSPVAAIKSRFEIAKMDVSPPPVPDAEPEVLPGGESPGDDTMLVAGTLLPAVLLQTVTSDEPGLVQARITHDVYDTLSGDRLAIPAGTTVLGHAVGLGAARQGVEMVWERLVFPDGRSLEAKLVGMGREGGLPSGKRKTHTLQKVGAVLLSASTAAALQVSQRPVSTSDVRFYAPGQVAVEEAVRDGSRVLDDWAAERLSRPPTVVLPLGSEVLVQLLDDLAL
jgi:hypothetical protein